MKKNRDNTRLSRRQALALGAGAVGAAWLGRGALGSREVFADQAATTTLAPATGVLKERGITGRTVNVHSHVLGAPTGVALVADPAGGLSQGEAPS